MTKSERWAAWATAQVSRDKRATTRGVSHITMLPEDWEKYGSPTSIKITDGQIIPIYPTGRIKGTFRWYYRKRKN